MKAIRIMKAKGKTAWHFLNENDSGTTKCGQSVLSLDVIEYGEGDTLPPVDGCHRCQRNADGYTRPKSSQGALGITAPSAPGRVRRTGPLNHGTRTHRGSRLG